MRKVICKIREYVLARMSKFKINNITPTNSFETAMKEALSATCGGIHTKKQGWGVCETP